MYLTNILTNLAKQSNQQWIGKPPQRELCPNFQQSNKYIPLKNLRNNKPYLIQIPYRIVSHILYNCPKYMNIRADIYIRKDSQMKTWYSTRLFAIKRLIKIFKLTECLSRKPKLSKADLSPKHTNKGQKRKKDQPHITDKKQAKQPKLTQFLSRTIQD